MKKILLAALVASFPVAHSYAASWTPAPSAVPAPIKNSMGLTHYIVVLQANASNGYSPTKPAGSKFPSWHKPEAQNLVLGMEKKYGFSATSMTSLAGLTFAAYLTDSQVSNLKKDPLVKAVFQNQAAKPSGGVWPDSRQDTAILPWGVNAVVGASPLLNSANNIVVYMVDEVVGKHHDLNVRQFDQNLVEHNIASGGCYQHGTHVAGIIGGKGNGVFGVYPGVKIESISLSPVFNTQNGCETGSNYDALSGIDAVMSRIMAANKVGILNMSLNWVGTDTRNAFVSHMRALATPVAATGYKGAFIAQSAGNNFFDACDVAYDDYDGVKTAGIMVVGALDANGQPMSKLNNMNGSVNGAYALSEPGSNYGKCVDVWAPGKSIYSTWKDSANDAYVKLTGTSMAAPHVAGVAAYLAETKGLQTPAQIEASVRSYMGTVPGSKDAQGNAISIVNLKKNFPSSKPTVEIGFNGWEVNPANVRVAAHPPMTDRNLKFDSVGATGCTLSRYFNNKSQDSIAIPKTGNVPFSPDLSQTGTHRWDMTCSGAGGATTASASFDVRSSTSKTVDVRSYVPAAAAPSGYSSYLRVVNTGTAPTQVTVARIDPVTGIPGTGGTLTYSLAAGGAYTYSGAQVEAAMGSVIPASERPRIRVSASSSALEVQSFMLQPGQVFNDVSGAQTPSGQSVIVSNYAPNAAAPYVSYLRVINTGTVATSVNAARIRPDGVTQGSGILNSSLSPGAAVTYSAAQVEAAMGIVIPASERPRILLSGTAANSKLNVQSFMLQPGGVFADDSTSEGGSSVDVRTYVPAAAAGTGYSSFLRIINNGTTATPITMALIDDVTGLAFAPKTAIGSLAGGAATTLTAAQVEAALGMAIPASSRPRIRVSTPSGTIPLITQSFMLQPGGAFYEVSNASVGNVTDDLALNGIGPTSMVYSYVPAAASGYASYIRIVNPSAKSVPVYIQVFNEDGSRSNVSQLVASLPGGAAQTFTSNQIESKLGFAIPANSRPRILLFSRNGAVESGTYLEVQSFMLNPGGAFTEVSGVGQ